MPGTIPFDAVLGRTDELAVAIAAAQAIVVAWPARGVDESRTVLPADAIAQGIADKVELWPWHGPQGDDEPPEIPEPTLPEGGWFAQHVSQSPPATDQS